MSASRWTWLGAAVIAALVLWFLRARGREDAAAPAVTSAAPVRPAVRAPVPPPQPGARTGYIPKIPEVTGHHLADPCRTVGEPTIPADLEEITREGITIAWPSTGRDDPGPRDAPLHPIMLAHLVSGLLAEAAALTGTTPRTTLAVILYRSEDELRARTKAPTWASGLYDGAAVRVPLVDRGDLGVSLATLRHEVMHAQLHAAVGCMPAWFNEGLAMYFAGVAPIGPWLEMLRTPQPLEIKTLGAPAIDEESPDVASRLYAQSLAMIVYLAERGGETGLRGAVQNAHTDPADLWARLASGAGDAAVLDALAHRMFGLPRGPELSGVLGSTICCSGLGSLAELGCRGVATRPGETIWIDRSTSPRATCSTRW